jgi:hypothetical protein
LCLQYYYNEEDAEYYNVKFDDWEEAASEQDATSMAAFGTDQRQCIPRTRTAANAQVSKHTPHGSCWYRTNG